MNCLYLQPSPLNLCDDNNSGDDRRLYLREGGEVLQGQTGINISFHESQEDADNAINALVSPYNNTANAQTIYVRKMRLPDVMQPSHWIKGKSYASPVAPEPIENCDDNDGFTFFTLETNEKEIINGN